jgi:hypothetical protein
MANKTVSGFGDTDMNGTYIETGTRNGQPYYVKDDACCLVYNIHFAPASFRGETVTETGGYYLIKHFNLRGAICQSTPEYMIEGTNVAANTWTALVDMQSNAQQVGTVV